MAMLLTLEVFWVGSATQGIALSAKFLDAGDTQTNSLKTIVLMEV